MREQLIRTALVTGASSGIGKSLCELLTAKGIRCCLVARREATLRELSKTLPGSSVLVADLSTTEGVEVVCEHLRDPPDLFVNNAGFGLYGSALSRTVEEQMELLRVNAGAVVELSLRAAAAFRATSKAGVILNVASAAALVPMPLNVVYGAAKALVVRFSLNLGLELRTYGIHVLCSCPGEVLSGFRERAARGLPQKRSKFVLSAERAAFLLWKQIESKEPLKCIDWKTRLGVAVSRCLPQRLVGHVIERRLRARIQMSKG